MTKFLIGFVVGVLALGAAVVYVDNKHIYF